MNIYIHICKLLCFIYIIFILISCKTNKIDTNTKNTKTAENDTIVQLKETFPNEKEAEIVDMTGLDGCNFMIKLKDGSRLEPINLEEIFKKNGLKVVVSYELYNGMSVCMAGKMIQITNIRKKEN